MVKPDTGEIVLDKSYPIVAYKVWWVVDGLGLYTELEKALETGRIFSPVAVAVSETGQYEALPPQVDPAVSQ